MNLGEQSTPVNPAGVRGSGPELEEVLQTFFHSELPHPWPAFVAPAPTVRLPLRRRLFTSNRLALAASIALLLLGSLALPTALQPRSSGPDPVGPSPTVADTKNRDLEPPAPVEEKPTETHLKR